MSSEMKDPGRVREDILVDIKLERDRQLEKGWDTAHDDDEHGAGQLAVAAGVLCTDILPVCDDMNDPSEGGNWMAKLARKTRANRKRQLTVAAALLVAELERLERGGFDGRPKALGRVRR